jgi:hypothetical protein
VSSLLALGTIRVRRSRQSRSELTGSNGSCRGERGNRSSCLPRRRSSARAS